MEWLLCVGSFLLLISPSEQFRNTKYGTNDYVSYQVGGSRSRIVITAPHGGTLKPDSISDRPGNGCYNSTNDECIYQHGCSSADDINECEVKSQYSDKNTQFLAVELANRIRVKLGRKARYRPHVVQCFLHRSKVDANRDLGEAAFGDPQAELAWEEYHSFIDQAKRKIRGEVLYIDVHGQSAYDWNMIGMLLPKTGGNGINKAYLPDRLAQYSSIMQLHVDSGVSMEELVRGNTSIGGLMQPYYDMVPSPTNMDANGNAYYIGGYSLRRHTGWRVSGFQIEAHYDIRNDEDKRRNFADKLADAIVYWFHNYL